MRTILAAALLALGVATAAYPAEFQPIGALGIGGAGVARMTGAYAPYWNPAGLAFSDSGFSSRFNAGAGIGINSTMAENIDRIGKLDINNLTDLNISSTATPSQNLPLVGKAAEFVGILNDLDHNRGTLSVTAETALAFQVQQFGVGGFTTMEMGALPSPDINMVGVGGVGSLADFAAAIGASTATYPTTRFFTDAQRAQITSAFGGNEGVTKALETQFANQGGSKTGQTPQQIADALVLMGNATTHNQGSLENNQSTLEYRGLILTDFPIAYGHKIDLGRFGQLGIGASVNILWGRAFIGESQIVKLKDSGDIVKNITDHFNDSVNVGVGLGGVWRYGDWLSTGIVAKYLNSPGFDTPRVTLPVRGTVQETIRVKPQVRAGVAVTPLSWLTLAADLDLTTNETVLEGQKNRTLGGGLELHPVSWFKFRLGGYKNLVSGDAPPLITSGITLGSKWANFDLDGASALETGTYQNSSYPKEAKVQLNFNMIF